MTLTPEELADELGRMLVIVRDATEAGRILRGVCCPGTTLATRASVAAARLREAEAFARELSDTREALSAARAELAAWRAGGAS
jgi:hypothetical protein